MNIVRKLKLSKLSGINYLSDTEKHIVNFVNSKILNLSEFTMVENPDEVFYMNKDGVFVSRYNNKSGYLSVRYDEDFSTFLYTENHGIKHSEMENLIQYLMETRYKLKIEYTSLVSMIITFMVESQYKTYLKNSYEHTKEA